VIAVLDTNSAPEGIDFPIPGNDDAARAISLYCDLIARAALDGMAAQMGSAGIDIGALEEAAVEEALAEEAPAAPAEAPAEEAAEPSGTAPELFSEAPEKVDDLKQITGVGPALEEKLNKLGVYTFAQVASWTPDQIAWIDDSLSFKGRVERDDWVGQAELLAAGK
jgi:small subunit ribosomal protein S2